MNGYRQGDIWKMIWEEGCPVRVGGGSDDPLLSVVAVGFEKTAGMNGWVVDGRVGAVKWQIERAFVVGEMIDR